MNDTNIVLLKEESYFWSRMWLKITNASIIWAFFKFIIMYVALKPVIQFYLWNVTLSDAKVRNEISNKDIDLTRFIVKSPSQFA